MPGPQNHIARTPGPRSSFVKGDRRPDRQALQWSQLTAPCLTGEHEAGIDRDTIHDHRARAAVAYVAADFSAG